MVSTEHRAVLSVPGFLLKVGPSHPPTLRVAGDWQGEPYCHGECEWVNESCVQAKDVPSYIGATSSHPPPDHHQAAPCA